MTIHEEFANPANLETAGSVERILLGLVNQPPQKRDEFISEELTNHLFQTPGFPFGMDLAAINIQRGRDHGIPPFAHWRQPCGLSPVRKWADLNRVMSPEAADKFRDLYASVEDIDLFSAGLAEKPVAGGLVGPTFACIIAQQFRNLRKGDRFWYENPFVENRFSSRQLQEIKRISLAHIMCRTTDNIDDIQPFVMLAADKRRNRRLSCEDLVVDKFNMDPWIEKPIQQRGSESADDEIVEVVEDDEVELSAGEEETESRNSAKKKSSPKTPQVQKPTRTRINQQNRITVKRPLAPHENLTIVVNNNAVHSPVFVSNSIYGTDVRINQFTNPGSQPEFDKFTTSSHTYEETFTSSPVTHRPRPTESNNYGSQPPNPYFPLNFQDQNNPNPPHYGFNRKSYDSFPSDNKWFSHNIPDPWNSRSTVEQSYFNGSRVQGEETRGGSSSTTKKPKPVNRLTTKPTFSTNVQETDKSFPSKSDEFYREKNNR